MIEKYSLRSSPPPPALLSVRSPPTPPLLPPMSAQYTWFCSVMPCATSCGDPSPCRERLAGRLSARAARPAAPSCCTSHSPPAPPYGCPWKRRQLQRLLPPWAWRARNPPGFNVVRAAVGGGENKKPDGGQVISAPPPVFNRDSRRRRGCRRSRSHRRGQYERGAGVEVSLHYDVWDGARGPAGLPSLGVAQRPCPRPKCIRLHSV